MNSEQDLIQKLMISKKIMEKHNDMGRNGIQSSGGMSSPMVEDYQPIQATYNLPQEFLSEQEVAKPINNGPMTTDRILGSKLPDEIKKLMMEHPIQQPTMGVGSGTLSNELVEKASRLMNTNAKGELLENKQPQKQQQRQQNQQPQHLPIQPHRLVLQLHQSHLRPPLLPQPLLRSLMMEKILQPQQLQV